MISGTRGVSWNKKSGVWEATAPYRLKGGGYLGSFLEKGDAEACRLEWERQNNYIPVTTGMTLEDSLQVLFKAGEGGLVYKVNTRGHTEGEIAGRLHSKGYTTVGVNRKHILVHRVVWFLHHGQWPSDQIDHINGVKTDNRIENLRDVTGAENQKNHPLRKDNKSGVAGVTWYKRGSKWEASIRISGKSVFLGRYVDFFEAVCARKRAELKYGFHINHGEIRVLVGQNKQEEKQ